MPLLLLIFFGLYGWIEFEMFIAVGNAIGGLATFLGVFITAFVGVALMKRQGAFVIKQWQTSLSKDMSAKSTLANGVSLILGSLLMLLPGYVTDLVGVLCFIPGFRLLIGQTILSRLGASLFSASVAPGFAAKFGTAGGFSSNGDTDANAGKPSTYGRQHPLEGEVIEGQYKSRGDRQNNQ